MGSDLGFRPTPLIKPCCGSNPHTKQRTIGTDVSSGTIFLKPKEEDLATNISSGPILLIKKRKKKIQYL